MTELIYFDLFCPGGTSISRFQVRVARAGACTCVTGGDRARATPAARGRRTTDAVASVDSCPAW